MRVPRPALVFGLLSATSIRFGHRNRRRSQFVPTAAATLLVAWTTPITVAPVPQPAALLLLGIGFAGAAVWRLRKLRGTESQGRPQGHHSLTL
jgi:hypothetical protein